jgi:excisionase family DNA binding protein
VSEPRCTLREPQDVAPLAYSVPDAAKSIGVNQRTVWRLLRDKEMLSFKLGARTLIRADELRAFIDRKSI